MFEMSGRWAVASLFGLAALGCGAPQSPAPSTASVAPRASASSSARPLAPPSSLDQAQALIARGRYTEAVELLRASSKAGGDRLRAACLEAEAERRAGNLAQAERTLRTVVADPNARDARLMLGEVLLELGRRADAKEPLLTLIADYNDGKIPPSDGHGLALVGRAAHLLRSPRDANEAFGEAEAAGDHSTELYLWRAELFVEKHDPGHAEEVLTDALERTPNDADALVWMAEVRLAQALDFVEAERLANLALSVNPRLARAYFVLAGVALRDVELDLARQRIQRGLAARPNDLDLLSLRAAVSFVAGDRAAFEADKSKVLGLNPERSRFYAIVGEFADWEHRYDDIVELMREATRLDPDDPAAHTGLGINLIRAGHDAEGVAELSRSFALDPFDPRVFNTLELFEKTIPNDYVTVPGARFRIRYEKHDRALLERYVPALLERAWSTFVQHYAFTPKTPIGVELYASRTHFAVRTSGLPETAIQGVCFGHTLASMSPQNESFNLGMTLWHELSHVFHIQLSASRVPRWFTEGLAEYETMLARPEWKREQDPELFELRRAGRLPPVEGLNRAFTRAEQLSDVATAYYASSRLVAMLGEQFGMKALSRMLELWGQNEATAQVMQEALGVGPAEIDRRFALNLDQALARYDGKFVASARSGTVDAASGLAAREPKSAPRQTALALALLRAGKVAAARAALARARALDPTDPDARFLTARIALSEGMPADAVKELRAMLGEGHDGFDVEMLLAEAGDATHDEATRLAALEAAARLDPTQPEPLYGLLRLADARNDADTGLDLLRRIAALTEHDAGIYRELLRRLVARGLFAEAVKVGDSAILVDMTSFDTHYAFAEALAQTGDKKRARFELESALLCQADPSRIAEAKQKLSKR
jgi:tetratricopeptide (TPR) repeat protein